MAFYKNIRRTRQADLHRRVLPAVALIVLLSLITGFVYWTRITLDLQAHAPPGAEHPFNWYAEACLGGAILALAVLLLARRAAPTAWRKTTGARLRGGVLASGKLPKRTRRTRVQ